MGKPGGRKKKNAGVGVDFKKVKHKVRLRCRLAKVWLPTRLRVCVERRCPARPLPSLACLPPTCRHHSFSLLQVGKKLPRAQNQTDTSFKSRTISLVRPQGTCERQRRLQPGRDCNGQSSARLPSAFHAAECCTSQPAQTKAAPTCACRLQIVFPCRRSRAWRSTERGRRSAPATSP